ncbi:MAG: energy transducer TonB [bacterium]|nr:energy transducer TonB [bacterium]
MKNDIFRVLEAETKSKRKWLFFPMSILVHFLLIGALIVIPLMSEVNDLPKIKVVRIISMAPGLSAPPPPPPPAAAAKRPGKKNTPKKVKPPTVPVPTPRFVEPVSIPDDVEDDGSDSEFVDGIDGGDPNGVVGGVKGGVIGGVKGGVIGGGGFDDFNVPLMVSAIDQPKLIKKVKPVYSTVALKAQAQGLVLVQAVTDIYGRVDKVRVITGHPLLRPLAIKAVKQWIYEPYMINSNPRPVTFTVSITFHLQR